MMLAFTYFLRRVSSDKSNFSRLNKSLPKDVTASLSFNYTWQNFVAKTLAALSGSSTCYGSFGIATLV
jgi:hypothetical protein